MNTFLPTVLSGMVADFAGSSAPAGWLLLDGSVKAQADYQSIYAIVGSTYNTGGEGAGNFRLPDCRGRVTIGAGTGSGITAKTLGTKSGEETHLLTTAEMAIHNHTQNSHNHSIPYTVISGNDFTAAADSYGTGSSTGSTTATNNPTGGDTPHNNMQPSIVFTKIIKI